MSLSCAPLFFAVALCSLCMTVMVSGATVLHLNEGSMQAAPQERAITKDEITALLNYHNFVRSQVSPSAANMEFMVWNETLATLADSWASGCTGGHGPPYVLKTIGQNVGFSLKGSSPVLDFADYWYSKRFDYTFPVCFGSYCGDYTQMVWATSTQLGCAVRSCSDINAAGKIWKEATFVICNYYPKGNLARAAPYRTGKPCTACPSHYRGSCKNKMCTKV